MNMHMHFTPLVVTGQFTHRGSSSRSSAQWMSHLMHLCITESLLTRPLSIAIIGFAHSLLGGYCGLRFWSLLFGFGRQLVHRFLVLLNSLELAFVWRKSLQRRYIVFCFVAQPSN